jgi:hypothetical protein
MKKLLITAAFIAASVGSVPASAAVYALGAFNVPPTQTVNLTPADQVATGNFQDEFRFSVLAPITLTASGMNTTALGLSNLDFGVVELRAGTGNAGSVIATYVNQAQDAFGFEATRLGALQLTAGSYTIVVNGKVTGAPARYDGNITFAAAAVPEPTTWAMLVGGFGILGAATRRTRRSKTVLA